MPGTPTNRGNSDQPGALAHTDLALSDPLPPDPFPIFKQWFDLAHARKIQPNPNAMTLATVSAEGRPSARIVLCKGIDLASGHIVFYTNERGRKGREIALRPHAAVVFHWDALDKQVRIEGPVVQSPAAESDAYFHTRPWLSKVGAWVSDQSEPIASRAALEAKLDETMRRFALDPAHPPAIDAKVEIPRPDYWCGYRLHAERIELWCAAKGRLHDRGLWTRSLRPGPGGDGLAFTPAGPWSVTRLQP